MTHHAPVGDLRPGAEAARVILQSGDHQSWILVLPGLWGADEILREVASSGAVLHLDGALSDGSPGGVVRAGLSTDGLRDGGTGHGADCAADAESLLREWGHVQRGSTAAGSLPVVLLESPELVDETSSAMLHDMIVAGELRMVTAVSMEESIPEFLASLRRAGRAQVLTQRPMTARDLDGALRRRLGAPVSATVLHRMTALCGAHTVLADRVLTAAQACGVLHRDEGPWIWRADEVGFHDALGGLSTEVLGGVGSHERELLMLTAFLGRVPGQWAADHYGDAVVHALREQRILSVDTGSPRGFLDLRPTAEALHVIVVSSMRRVDEMRLWYAVGRTIPAEAAGAASQARLIWWRARVEGVMAGDDAEFAVQTGMALTWYRFVCEVVETTAPSRPDLWVYAARAYYALGETVTALRILQTHLSASPTAPDAGARGTLRTDWRALRSAVLLAERIAIFHPELASPVAKALREQAPETLTPHLDGLLHRHEDLRLGTAEQALRQVRTDADCQEGAMAQLWLGAHLGLRRYPDLGRLVLSLLLDDLRREGGQPDVEESAMALLLQITAIHGWRTDVLRVNVQAWNGRRIRGPALAAVTDLISATVAMRQDRMASAFQYASSAARTFERADPFGLLPLAMAVAAATASYVNQGLSLMTHRVYWERFGSAAVRQGQPSMRLTAEGMATVGSALSPEVVIARLMKLATEALTQGEWAQQQQLLLLAMLGRSVEAAQAVLAAPWHREPGRSRMIGLLAQAMTSESPEEALNVAELLIDSDASFFGLTIIASRWGQLPQLARETRARVIRAVLAARRRAGEPSWLLDTFSDLALDQREVRILRALHAGHTTRSIAAQLHISPRTVEATISVMLRRFSCANRVELLSLDLLHG